MGNKSPIDVRPIAVVRRVPQELPTPGYLYDNLNPNNIYRVVITQSFGTFKAMYLMNELGEYGWYTSYTEKLIVPVINWIELPNF